MTLILTLTISLSLSPIQVRTGQDSVVEWLLQHHANVSEPSESGETALAVAAFDGKFNLVWRLHEAGADLHATNEYGGNALMSAVHHASEADVVSLALALALALALTAHPHP